MAQERVGPAGKVLAANLQRIRKASGLSFAELSALTEDLGAQISVLTLRRIERFERRVDFDDLLVLAAALQVRPIDLMVPDFNHTNTVPYPVGGIEVGALTARNWIAGRRYLRENDRFIDWPPVPTAGDLEALLVWLPEGRRQRVIRDWMNEQFPDVDEKEDR